MATPPCLVLRADAGGPLGSGHVMRMLALGEAWVDAGGTCVLASVSLPGGLAARIDAAPGFTRAAIDALAWSAADCAALIATAIDHQASATVVDSYKVEAAYLAGLEAGGVRACFVDDLARLATYPCSLIVNPNFGGEAGLYAGKTNARLLMGPSFVMLRQEFSALAGAPRLLALEARRLLVTFGGVDPKGVSLIALDALAALPEIEATLIVGAANERADQIAAKAKGCANVTIVRDARDMAARIRDCDMILSGGGTTVWEAASHGAPMMLVASAPEEDAAAKRLSEIGLCAYLGPAEILTPATLASTIEFFSKDLVVRSRSSTRGRELVDGRGAERVVKAIRNAIG